MQGFRLNGWAHGLCRAALSVSVGLSLGLGLIAGVQAQEYPAKPIKMIVPYAPGGGGDLVGRSFNEELGRILGQPVIIENHPGGSTLTGTEMLVRAKPDGYTLLLTNDSLVMNPVVQPSMNFETPDDFTPIARLITYPFVLAVHSSLNVNTLPELIDRAKAGGKALMSGTTGPTSGTHITTVLLNQLAGIEVQSVPFSGGGPVIQALAGGHIDMAYAARSLLMPFVDNGTVKLVGATGRTAIGTPPVLPFAEQGVPDYNYELWWGVLAPKGTPDDVVQKVNAALKQVMASEETTKRLASIEGKVTVTSPKEFDDFVRSEIARWTTVVKPEANK